MLFDIYIYIFVAITLINIEKRKSIVYKIAPNRPLIVVNIFTVVVVAVVDLIALM